MANHIFITGTFGRDPELRTSSQGAPWATFSVADGRKGEEPVWFEGKAFGRLAEVLGEYGAKGRRVLIVGKMVQEHFKTQAGEERTVMRLIASNVEFLDAPPDTRRKAREDTEKL